MRRRATYFSIWLEIACGWAPPAISDFNLGLEDRDRLADDPHGVDGAVLDFQLDVHAPGAMQLVALYAAEGNPWLIARQEVADSGFSRG